MPKSKRKNQENVWVAKEFKELLVRIKAKKILSGERIENLGQITEQMIKTPAMKEVEKQLVKQRELILNLGMDRRRKRF